MKQKVYLAARYSRREEMLGYAADIREAGHECCARRVEGLHDGVARRRLQPTTTGSTSRGAERVRDVLRGTDRATCLADGTSRLGLGLGTMSD